MDNKKIESIFLKDAQIYKDRTVLSEGYLPKALIGRDEQIEDVAYAVAPVAEDSRATNLMIYGPSGSGKTVVVRHVLNQLKQALKKTQIEHNFADVYVSCTDQPTTKVLVDVIYTLDPDCKFPKSGWSIPYYYELLWKMLNDRKINLIIIMDEIDKLKSTDLLYHFTRAGENQLLPNAHMSIIGISNNTRFIEQLDSRIVSSFRKQDLIFQSYNADQLTDILNARAKDALVASVYDQEVLRLCAAYAAQYHGDARSAIRILDVSASLVERDQRKKITVGDVERAHELFCVNNKLEIIKGLPQQKRAVLLAIAYLHDGTYKMAPSPADTYCTGEVALAYVRLCRELGITPMVKNRVSMVLSELDTLGLIDGPVVNKGRHGVSRNIGELSDLAGVKSVLEAGFGVVSRTPDKQLTVW